ncbi:MAG: outer membrane lipid asymmetry maintenance protein MlaD [Pseudomonadota bacterium]
MASNAAETAIGAVVLAAAAGFLAYAAQTADIGLSAGAESYTLKAAFRKAEGVGVGGDVRIAGVKVGAVRALELDPQTYRAVAQLEIDADVKLPDDSDASILTEGLLGGSYVSITPGGSDLYLADGDELMFTQGSVNLMDLVGAAISGRGE